MATSSWRSNPWVWLIIAIPAATVIGCLFTIYLAINNPETLVDDVTSQAPAKQETVVSRLV